MDSTASSEWTDPYLLEKFANHETRPNNLVLKPLSGTLPHPRPAAAAAAAPTASGSAMMMTTSGSGSLSLASLQHHHPLPLHHHHQAITKTGGSGPYFHTATGAYHPMTTTATTTTTSAGREPGTTTNLVVQNGDLDINVNVIKSMLLANRVPESCV